MVSIVKQGEGTRQLQLRQCDSVLKDVERGNFLYLKRLFLIKEIFMISKTLEQYIQDVQKNGLFKILLNFFIFNFIENLCSLTAIDFSQKSYF